VWHVSSLRPNVSIVIKALNEERHIAAAIESAMAALEGMRGEIIGEIILADSASTDRTVEIAATYPIKIVTLRHPADRSCGTGVQLAYQYSTGDFVCLIDGDMALHKEFLPAAIDFLVSNPQFAGVGGLIVERETGNVEYVKRARDQGSDLLPGEVTRLDCGGVYRRAAIQAVRYLGDRNLHGSEELELGARLRAQGWKLARIPVEAIDHHGHSGNAYALLRRRWTTRFAFSTGEILRGAFGTPAFTLVLRKLRWELFLFAAVYAWWLCLIATLLLAGSFVTTAAAVTALVLIPFLTMALRCRSLNIGIYSVTAWNVYAAGLWPGLLRPRVDPAAWIDSVVIRDAAVSERPVHAA
jgi:glycosyltransferase involved in cell wall biosynthesis